MVLLRGCGIPAREIVLSFELVVRCAAAHPATGSFRIQAIAHCSHSHRKLFAILAEIFLCLNANSLKVVARCCGALFYF
jgi:hypothetical protein